MSIHTPSAYSEKDISHFLHEIEAQVSLSSIEKEKIKLVYSFADLLHHDERRKDGTHYFEHPKDVVRILQQISNPTPKQIIIALLHDLIENTAVEYNLIKHLFGKDIADGVEQISKKCWTLYIKDIPQEELDEDEIQQIENLKKSNIVHEILTSGEIDDNEVNIVFSGQNFDEKKEKIKTLISLLLESYGESDNVIYDIIIIDATPQDRLRISSFIHNLFYNRNNQLKVTFHEYTKKDNLPLYRNFSEKVKALARRERGRHYFENMRNLPYNILIVKFADRLHNLMTTRSLTPDKKRKLLQETRKYFLPIAMVKNTQIHEMMSKYCIDIEKSLTSDTIESVIIQ